MQSIAAVMRQWIRPRKVGFLRPQLRAVLISSQQSNKIACRGLTPTYKLLLKNNVLSSSATLTLITSGLPQGKLYPWTVAHHQVEIKLLRAQTRHTKTQQRAVECSSKFTCRHSSCGLRRFILMIHYPQKFQPAQHSPTLPTIEHSSREAGLLRPSSPIRIRSNRTPRPHAQDW